MLKSRTIATPRRLCLLAVTLTLASVPGCSKNEPGTPNAAPKAAGSKAADTKAGDAGTADTKNAATVQQMPSENQVARAGRSLALLQQRQVPVYDGPLFVDDEEDVTLQTAADVARRTLVLWAVELRAEGIPRDEAHGLISTLDLWGSVSPEEKAFLDQDEPDPAESQALVWRLESIWVLLWALGYVEDLDWPEDMCEVPRLVEIMRPLENNPDFIANAKLRDAAEILDAQDLTMRIHWAIRDAHLNSRHVPRNLDWSGDTRKVAIGECAAVGVVEQRHYVLNWLVRFLDPKDWDHVDTPT